MTRLVLISDTHGLHEEMTPIPDGDILIHAGDLTRNGTLAELTTATSFFAALPHAHKIIIAGNHDFCFQREPARARKLLLGMTYLQDKLIKVMGLKIYGSPWQPTFGDFAFNAERGTQLKEIWSLIPSDIDVLVTHGPPYSVFDSTFAEHHNVGCKDLLEAVSKVKPKLHVFGHIHCGYGMRNHQGTTFVNACVCDENYQPVNAPIIFDI